MKTLILYRTNQGNTERYARDIAAGGQGAPLVPAFHRAVFAGEEDRAVLNVGGIANVTILTKEKTEGFDTGPGNMLLDAWCQREKGEAFDRDGAFARKGRLLPELLDELLSDPYFTLPPPKSTGRETFHLGWLTKRLGARRYAPEDVARTLTVLTARTATDAIRRWAPGVSTLFVCGGGALNPLLMEELRNAFDGSVHSTEALGIDPMDVIDEYGVDALRFFLTTNSTPGQDLRFSAKKIESSWNFINKIWNATRFVQMQIEDMDMQIDLQDASIIDKWILRRFNEVLASVTANMERYEFALVGNELYGFIWDEFCSWYIELSKAGLQSDDVKTKRAAESTLLFVLQGIVKMLHPFMPFVTEEIYLSLPHGKPSLNVECWPQLAEVAMSEEEMNEVKGLISMITAVREIRKDYDLKPSMDIQVFIRDEKGAAKQIDERINAILMKMCHASCMKEESQEEMVTRPVLGGTLSTPLAAMINVEEEIAKLEKEAKRLQGEIRRGEGMLSNPGFINKAPAAKVEAEKEKLENYKKQYDIVSEELNAMKERAR